MIKYTVQEVTQVVDGILHSAESEVTTFINEVIIDSRTPFKAGETLFFAIKGPRNDGHDYIPELVKRGLNCFVVSNPDVITKDADFILVTDVVKALQLLASYKRSRFKHCVVGITGSNGKTIVKEWLHQLLSGESRIVRSPKSYNSQVGVPLSVLQIDKFDQLGIFEAGISLPGEMVRLEEVIRPEVGIFTNLGDAHQENFLSKKEKRDEKLKLFERSEKLVFSADQPGADELFSFCKEHKVEPFDWSMNGKESFICFESEVIGATTHFTATVGKHIYQFYIPFTDQSSVENACHCFSALIALSRFSNPVIRRFADLTPVEMRLEIKQGINNCLLVNDHYNSDLTSLSMALSVLNQQARVNQKRKVVILSDILQTGIPSAELYEKVNSLFEKWEVDELIGIGREISANSSHFSMKTTFYIDRLSFEQDFQSEDFRNIAILIKGARIFELERISARLEQKAHKTVLEIDLNAVVANLNTFKELLPSSTKMMVMVKAFSYGAGDVEVAKLLQFHNVDFLAVAVADEGVELRNAGVHIPIVVMNPEEHSFQKMIEYRLEPNIFSCNLARVFEVAVRDNDLRDYPVHIKVDTGMNRLGFKSSEESEIAIDIIKESGRLKVSSIFSHLAGSDSSELDSFTKEQFDNFDSLTSLWIEKLGYHVDRHILNSAGIERFPERAMDMVRPGIGLYGISVTGLNLQSVCRFISTVSLVKKAVAGETVGYNRRGILSRDSEIAIVPVGYADGLNRKLGNGIGKAYIKEREVPIVGNICMDMLMLDVTGLEVNAGDQVELFGPNIPLSDVAKKLETIPYEILTSISQRVKRVYLYE